MSRDDALVMLCVCCYVVWFFALGAVAGAVRLLNHDVMPAWLSAVLITLAIAPIIVVALAAVLACARSAWRDLRAPSPAREEGRDA